MASNPFVRLSSLISQIRYSYIMLTVVDPDDSLGNLM